MQRIRCSGPSLPCRRPLFHRTLLWLALGVATLLPQTATAQPAAEPALRVERADALRATLAAARDLAIGDRVVVERLAVGGGTSLTLDLERTRVWAGDAVVRIHGAGGVSEQPAPQTLLLRGRVVGEPGSRVSLHLRGNGELRGIVAVGDRHWLVHHAGTDDTAPGGADRTAADAGARRAAEREPATLQVHEAATTVPEGEGFACANAELQGGGDLAALFGPDPLDDLVAAQRQTLSVVRGAIAVDHTVRVAIETDYEYFQKFGNVTDATDYVTDLLGWISTIYEDEVGTNLLIPHLSLWTNSNDPWNQSGASCGMYELGGYWHSENGGVDRSIVHMLSGKNTNSGVAWVGVLCYFDFRLNNVQGCNASPTGFYGGGYGFTGGIDANFNPANPGVLWDSIAVAHEIGHNYNSPHTHCYNGLGGSAQPVDQCYNGQASDGCYAGTQRLPGGAGSGTIMSYCHLRAGGFGNISPTFGAGHPWGVLPDRVPERMRGHVETRAASAPACLALDFPDGIFADGFEGGDTAAWDE